MELLKRDPILAKIINNSEITQPSDDKDVYLSLLNSIVSQQLSVKAAETIFKRFLGLFPDNYPHTDLLLELPVDQLRAAGLSFQKAGYLRNVAEFHRSEGLHFEKLSPMDDEALIRYITRIKGVGRWTAEMILMFVMNRPDIFPADDLGIQQAIRNLYGLSSEGRSFREEIFQIAESWRPHRTLACLYLWRYKDAR